MQCNGDFRHVIEILAVLCATGIYYRETKHPLVTLRRSRQYFLDLLNTPLGWSMTMTTFLVVAFPVYIYFYRKDRKINPTILYQGNTPSNGRGLFLKTVLVFGVCFYLTYKQ